MTCHDMLTFLERQDLHEAIREHSMEAGRLVKLEGKDNDLMKRIREDSRFKAVRDDLDKMMDPQNFVGRAPQQVEEFIHEEIDPILEKNQHLLKAIDQAKAKEVNV